MSKGRRRLTEKARDIKKNTLILYFAGKHPDLPLKTRIFIGFTVAYALSPVDLIPDFIPLLGYLDDLILLPLFIALCIKSIPAPVWEDARRAAEKESGLLKKNWVAGGIILCLWAAVIGLIAWKIWERR